MTILQLNSARNFVGEAAHTLNLTEALRRAGHRVFLGLRQGHPTHLEAQRRGLEPLGFHLQHRWWPPRDLPDLRQIARLVREQGVSVIHAHRGKEHWQAVMAARIYRLGIPVLRTRHVTMPLRANPANRWLARRTACLIAVSRAVEADVRSTGLYPPERLRLIPGGLDLARFAPRGLRQKTRERLGLASEAPAAICVARFETVKAQRVLLAAWASLRPALPLAVLLLVGGGSLEAQLEAQARECGILESVRFLGRKENAEIPELLEAADVGVLSSTGSEGFSRAVLEYMALGLPVAATRVGAVPDLVEDGVSGRIVPPEDPQALALALRELLSASAGQRKEWGQAGRAKAEAGHGYETWAAAHERTYREVLAEHA